MGRPYSQNAIGRSAFKKIVQVHLQEGLGIGRRTILELILNKWVLMLGIGLIRLRTGTTEEPH